MVLENKWKYESDFEFNTINDDKRVTGTQIG